MKKLIFILMVFVSVFANADTKIFRRGNGTVVGRTFLSNSDFRLRFNQDSTTMAVAGTDNYFYYANEDSINHYLRSNGVAYGSVNELVDSIIIKNTYDVFIQDQYTESIDLYLCDSLGSTTSVNDIEIGDKYVKVVSTSNAVQYGCIDIMGSGHHFQSIINLISNDTVYFNSPVDFDFDETANVCFGQWDLSEANGLITPVIYKIRPPVGVKYDIYAISVNMEDNTVMYESTFAGISQLSNGLVIRVNDGYNKQLALISNNAGFREYGFDTEYPSKVPSGTYAFWANKNYKEGNGVSIRLDGDFYESIEIVVSDSLIDVTKIAATIHGHVVD